MWRCIFEDTGSPTSVVQLVYQKVSVFHKIQLMLFMITLPWYDAFLWNIPDPYFYKMVLGILDSWWGPRLCNSDAATDASAAVPNARATNTLTKQKPQQQERRYVGCKTSDQNYKYLCFKVLNPLLHVKWFEICNRLFSIDWEYVRKSTLSDQKKTEGNKFGQVFCCYCRHLFGLWNKIVPRNRNLSLSINW